MEAGLRLGVAGRAAVTRILQGLGLVAPPPRGPQELSVAGLDGEVLVERDERGIPWIHARSMQDALLAQGYLHGLERGFQMDLWRRLATGRLAEWFGAPAVAHDRFMRRLNFRHWAEASTATWSENTRRYVAAYARGVNLAWAAKPLATEFRLLRARPEPWRESDTNLLIFWMSWLLNRGWWFHWAHHRLGGDPLVRAWLLDPLPEAAPTIVSGTGSAVGGVGLGSNSWAVAPWRSASGFPLLANDPHLAPTFPAPWYLMMIEGGALHAFGATLPGAPGVVIGQNQEIAWAFTNLNADVHRLVRLELTGDGGRYRVQDRWERLGVREEHIRVRGQGEVVQWCRDSHLGPVVTELSPKEVVVLHWTGFAPQSTVQALLGLNRAHDWESFNLALAEWGVPVQSVLYADRSGHIGYVAVGRLPAASDTAPGLVDGNAGEGAFLRFWDWQAHPRAYDPPGGILVAANNPPGGEVPVPGFHSLGYRARRIAERLLAVEHHTPKTMAALFTDCYSAPLWEVCQRLLAQSTLPEGWREALEAFDGQVRPEAVAPTLLYTFLFEALPDPVRRALREPFWPEAPRGGLGLAHPAHFGWLLYERLAPAVLRFWDAVAVQPALARAHQRVVRDLGHDRARWRWGEACPVVPLHPLGRVRGVGAVFAFRPLAAGGDLYSVQQLVWDLDPEGRWPTSALVVPGLRLVMDLGHPQESCGVVFPGQSGHPTSPHAADQVASWLLGELGPVGPGMEAGDWVTLRQDRPWRG
ncbi:MAG: penicillin acylase family protein [Firmicutes bacterium]|nr:penicillin acylase family protein [Alicyclobacillaceae bacterium]MCL6496195.1 penicillin acylase family protein [Bacillota bacterium]